MAISSFSTRLPFPWLFDPILGHGPHYGTSWSQSVHTPQSEGRLWTTDRLDAETSTWQYTTITREKYPCPGEIRTRNPSKQAAADRVTSRIGSFLSLDRTSGFNGSVKWVSVAFWSGNMSGGKVHKAALYRSANPDNRIRICHCCECRLSTCEHRHFFY